MKNPDLIVKINLRLNKIVE